METKQKVTMGIAAVIVGVIIWQGWDMVFEPAAPPEAVMKPNPDIPKPASLLPPAPQQAPMTEREMQLTKLQQETQAKYLAQLTELQMLKIEKDIAETTKDISKAKLDSITAQKDIVDLLTPKKPAATSEAYAQGLDPNAAAQTTTTSTTSTSTQESTKDEDMKVVSVSKLRGQWTAVIGASGALISVKVGDTLPAGGWIITSIDTTGVSMEKDGKKKKVPMAQII